MLNSFYVIILNKPATVLLLLGFFVVFRGAGQHQPKENELAGFVKSKSGAPLAHAVIYVRSDSQIVHYTLTDSTGYFRFPPHTVINRNDTLIVRLLGYEQANYRVGDIFPGPEDYLLIELNERIGVLEEVIIRPKENRIPFNDTTSILVKRNEREKQTLEDLLKKLPGFSVDEEGNIGYKGKPIKKIFLEGADLTSTNYKRLSKSMSSELVSRIDVIERFVENKLLGGLVVSDEVVLNLAVDSLRKNRPFGNANLAFGNKGYRNLGGNGFFIKPAYKAHIQFQTNNIGLCYDPAASALQREFNVGVFSSEKLNSPVLKYRQFASGNFGNTNINNEYQFGLAGVLQSRNGKLKWNHDVSMLFDTPSQIKQDSLSVVFGAASSDQFQSMDVYTIKNKLSNIYIRNRMIWSLNKTQQLDISAHLNGSASRLFNQLSQNIISRDGNVSDVIDESIRTEMLQTDIFLEYTNRFQSNRALLVNFNAGYNTYPQQLALTSNQQRFVYPPDSNSVYSVINQHLINTNREASLKIRMLNTIGRYTYEFFGEAACNHAQYNSRTWNPQINDMHQLAVKKWFVETGLSIGFSLNRISAVNTAAVGSVDFQSLGNYWFPYWNSKISWHLSKRSRFEAELLHSWHFPEIHQIADFHYYSDFNLLQTGLGSVGRQRSTSLMGSYRYENLRSFWNIQTSAGIRHRTPDFVTDLSITPLITTQRLFLSQRTTSAFSETEATKFIPQLKVRFTSSFMASKYSFFNLLNSDTWRDNSITEYHIKVDAGTSFGIPFNFFVTANISEIRARTAVVNSGILQSNKNTWSYLRFLLQYKNKTTTTRFSYQHVRLTGYATDLFDITVFMKPEGKSYLLSFSAQNITNQRFIYQFIRTDLYYSQFAYNILPAFFQIGIHFSF